MVFRLANILINRTDFDKEMEVIKEIVRFNEYDDYMISKLVQKQKWLEQIRLATRERTINN